MSVFFFFFLFFLLFRSFFYVESADIGIWCAVSSILNYEDMHFTDVEQLR